MDNNNNGNFMIAALIAFGLLIFFGLMLLFLNKDNKGGGFGNFFRGRIGQKIEQRLDEKMDSGPQFQRPERQGPTIIVQPRQPLPPPVVVAPPRQPPVIVVPPPRPPVHWVDAHRRLYILGYEDGSHGLPIRRDSSWYLKGYNDGRCHYHP